MTLVMDCTGASGPVTRAHRVVGVVVLAMITGAVTGAALHAALPPESAQKMLPLFGSVTEIFLRLIKMIIAPLVFATLVSGIARAGSGAALGRLTVRTLVWFIAAGLLSMLLGILLATLLRPGVGVPLHVTLVSGTHVMPAPGFDLQSFVTHLVPRSIFEALADNEILQIVVFALFMGVALAALGERAAALVASIDVLAETMLRVTGYVMGTAPFAVFAAVASVVTVQGAGVLGTFGKLIGTFYLALATLWGLMALVGYLFLGRALVPLLRAIREPVLLAFATASSEAAYPKTLQSLSAVGVPSHIASVVLPLGYSFNLDGSMMYCAFALIFIAQAYGIELSFTQQLAILLLLMVSSKGLAGVPRASLVVVATALPHFQLPEAGLLLLLGIDPFLDMGRTATNVFGNSLAAAVLAKRS